MDPTKAKIERFIRRAIFNDNQAPLEKLSLSHCPQGGKPVPVWSKPFEDGADAEHIDPVLQELMQVVTDDASGMGGVQRYILVAKVGGETHGRLSFRMQGYDETIDDINSEGPNSTGLIAQQMRHNEALAKSSHMAMGGVLQYMTRLLDKTMKHNEKLMEQRLEDFATVEEAMSRKHERDMEMMEAVSKQELKSGIIEKVGLMLPTVVNRISGQNVLPATTSPKDEMLKSIIHSLRPDQLEKLQQVLDVEQLLPLLELMKTYQAEEAAHDEPATNSH